MKIRERCRCGAEFEAEEDEPILWSRTMLEQFRERHQSCEQRRLEIPGVTVSRIGPIRREEVREIVPPRAPHTFEPKPTGPQAENGGC